MNCFRALQLFVVACCIRSFSLFARVSADAVGDMRSLLEFKRAIVRDPFNALANWQESSPNACNWTGISCSNKHPGRVVQIFLEDATLQGSMAPHIGNLSFLKVLDFANNSLFREITSSIGKLQRLKLLDLSTNNYEGAFPASLGNLSSLQYLYVCDNFFSGDIPVSLKKLKGLRQLVLYRNSFTGQIPQFIGQLNRLDFLDLSDNQFHGNIPAMLGNLSNLLYIDIGSNYFRGSVPCSIAKLSGLEFYRSDHNLLSGSIPPCLTNLTNLRKLDLSENKLQGWIPSLRNFHGIEEIYLSYNSLQGGIPDGLGNCTSLRIVELDSNKLKGYLPSSVSYLIELQTLALADNQFVGRIPDSWANVTGLQTINLFGNRLSGTISSWIRGYWNLQWINIGENLLTSGVSDLSQPVPIFPALSNCSDLYFLGIQENRLTGRLPLNLGKFWPKLQTLWAGDNLISGKIPVSLQNFSSLIDLDLHGNNITGTIPSQLSNMKVLQGLCLGDNKLHGEIPGEVARLKKTLSYLNLSHNQLSGSIPESTGELKNLRKLILNDNLLYGKIPEEIGNCRLLEDLQLSKNNLSGPIPAAVADLKSIQINFDLSRNALDGDVPKEIGGLSMAQVINLSNNNLSGNISLYMINWLNAYEVNLSFNAFSGSLSSTVANQLKQLQIIDLSNNHFTGTVPGSLLNLSSLKFGNLSYNDFDGEISCSHIKVNLTKWSFFGNPNLCGRCAGLGHCKVVKVSRSSRILKIVLISSLLIGFLLLVCAGILFHRRKTKKAKLQIPRLGEQFLKLSLQELLAATDNFSAANLVGEGSCGKVYKGTLSSGYVVAIKCFTYLNRRAQKSFQKECQTLGKVRHRNILKIITVVCSDEVKAMVTPMMCNGNLHTLLHSRNQGQIIPLNVRAKIRILQELASGLSYLHHDCTPQIIHCDIKPENVLLDGDMTVKISDFGIARLRRDAENFDVREKSSSSMKGSAGYIAPEYGVGERISEKGDVYSFGVVTLEVMTRMKPTDDMFSGDLTLSKWISMSLQQNSAQERREKVKDIMAIAEQAGGGLEMENEGEMDAVERILMMGLRCTSEDARMRPTMREVESFLQSLTVMDNARRLPRNFEEVLRGIELQPLPRESYSSTF